MVKADILLAGDPDGCINGQRLLRVLEEAQHGWVDIVLVDTITCLGCHYFDVADLMAACEALGVEIWTVEEGRQADDISVYFEDAQ